MLILSNQQSKPQRYPNKNDMKQRKAAKLKQFIDYQNN